MNVNGKWLGWRGYASIVRETQKGPVHAVDLVERMGLCRDTARKILTRLHELGVVSIASWVVIKPARTAIPVYRYGSFDDAPGISGKPGGWVRQPMALHNRLPELTHFVTILRALEEPITLPKLCKEVGSRHSNILPLIKHAKKIKLVRVAEWDRTRNGPVAMYAIGSGTDVPRPAPMSSKEVNLRWATASRAREKQMRILRSLHHDAGVSA